MAAGRTPNLQTAFGRWDQRHSPATFTYAAHAAFFAGFLPTPAAPGRHARRFALRFDGSETIAATTCVLDGASIVEGLAARGYHTLCVGGVGFFNGRNPLGRVLPSLFAEAHWDERLGVTDPRSFEHQTEVVEHALERVPTGRHAFTFINVSALHQPNFFHHVPGAPPDDTPARKPPRRCSTSVRAATPAGRRADPARPGVRDRVQRSRHRVRRGRLSRPPHRPPGRDHGTVRRGDPVTVEPWQTGSRYQAYSYAYPHKTSYRRLDPAVPLPPLWAGERRDALSLYVHVPFCEMRCGFCNLFTRPVPRRRHRRRVPRAARASGRGREARARRRRTARVRARGGRRRHADLPRRRAARPRVRPRTRIVGAAVAGDVGRDRRSPRWPTGSRRGRRRRHDARSASAYRARSTARHARSTGRSTQSEVRNAPRRSRRQRQSRQTTST